MTRDRRILFFGDSFVAGVGDPAGLGWVGRVVAASFAAGHPLTAYNLGVRGDTSLDVAARWRAEADARMRLAPEASYGVVFAVGVNDTSLGDGGGVRVEPGVAVDALGRLIDSARDRGLDVLVVGPPPAGDEPEQDARIGDLSTRLGAVAAARDDVPFVVTFDALCDVPAWRAEALAGDGWHPGAAGYRALSDIVLNGGWMGWLDR